MRRPSPLKLLSCAAVVALALACCGIVSAQDQQTLRKIEVIGWQRVLPDQIIKLSGLQVGQNFDRRAVDAAEDKLMDSGLFRGVSYQVRVEDNDVTVIFEVHEKAASGGTTSPGGGDLVGRVAWNGNRALTNDELLTAFGLRSGDPAGATKIGDALESVRKAYARKGYLDAQITQSSARDAATRRLDYQFTVREGQQYRMGLFTVTGLSVADTRQLKSKWTLVADAIYDDGYLDQFRTTVIRPFVATLSQRTGTRSKYEVNAKPDPQKQTVDVVIAFK